MAIANAYGAESEVKNQETSRQKVESTLGRRFLYLMEVPAYRTTKLPSIVFSEIVCIWKCRSRGLPFGRSHLMN